MVDLALASGDPCRDDYAEQCALGAAVLDAGAAAEVLRVCPVWAFAVPAHRAIAEAVKQLRENGAAIDLVTVRDRLVVSGTLEAAGGVGYLAHCAEQTPSIQNATYYAEIVRQKADLRHMFSAAQKIAKAAKCGDLARALAEHAIATEILYSKSASASPQSVMDGARKGHRPGVPLFLESLNALYLNGGAQPGKMHAYCAQSGKGKSTWLCQQVTHCLAGGYRVGVVSLEMAASDLAIKQLRQMTGFSSEAHAGSHGLDAAEDYRAAHDRLSAWLESGAYSVLDGSDDGASLSQVLAWMDVQVKTNNTQVFFIDYVQDIRPDDLRMVDDWKWHKALSSKLRLWAKHRDVTLWGLFQIDFNKAEFYFRGGSQYYRDCASIVVKAMAGKIDGAQEEYLTVAKNRYGRTGKVGVIYDARTDSVRESW